MQLISCPWCGPREETEFHYGGTTASYPADPALLDDEAWARFVFVRPNPKGPATEQWSHAAGCRRWFTAVRDTRTHRFVSAAVAR